MSLSTPLYKRRKAELKELASSLGLSEDGLREDIVERIRFHISKSGDASLHALLREGSPAAGNETLTSIDASLTNSSGSGMKPRTTVVTTESITTSASAPSLSALDPNALHATTRRGSRSSQGSSSAAEWKVSEMAHGQSGMRGTSSPHSSSGSSESSSSSSTRRYSGTALPIMTRTHTRFSDTENDAFDSGALPRARSAVLQIPEHEVRQFMEHMQEELHGASDLAHDLNDTLHTGFEGSSSRRLSSSSASSGTSFGSRKLGAHRTVHDDDKKDKDEDEEEEEVHKHGRRLGSEHRRRSHDGDHGVAAVASHCDWSVVNCAKKYWKTFQDLGSSSTGLVWLTLLLELGVFLHEAFSQHHHNESGWFHLPCLSFLFNWPNFLAPFLSYYITFFLLPTLLSQLFNVDRTASRKQLHFLPGGTTSALSFFAFKFALTYFLGHSAGLKHLLGGAGSRELWAGCKYISEVFRYIPQSLGLATAGVGTVLSLAESIVNARRR